MFYLFYLSTFKKNSQVSVSQVSFFYVYIVTNKQYLDKKDAFKPSDFRLRKDNEKYEVQLLSGLHPENKGQRSG